MSRGQNVWYNGKVLPAESAKISLFTHALHYGMGAFEGIRAYKQDYGPYKGSGAVFRLKEHMDRLVESVKILGLKMPYSSDVLCEAAAEVCKSNNFQECYIRPITYIGDGPLGVYPGDNPPVDVAILTWVWGKYLGDKGVQEGVHLKTSSFIRPHVNSVMTKGKITGQYVTGVLAKSEAKKLGYEEGLLLDPEGFLSEGTGENLFIVKDGIVKTTSLTSILNGITRRTVIEMLKKNNLQVEEARFTRDELWCADEVFLTGTAAEITPVSSVDDRPIGKGATEGKPGEVTMTIQKQYAALVRGELNGFPESWLTKV